MAHNVVLTWTASPDVGAGGYNIFRGTASGKEGSTPINPTPVTGTTYTDTNVVAGQTYFYTVETELGGASSAPSNEASATVPLAAPTALTASAS